RVRGEAVGVVNLESTRRYAFTHDDQRLAETFALHISGTLERIKLDEERQRAAEAALRGEAAAEQARMLATVKMRFLSTATHEIRTPLTSIIGYTELIQDALQSGDTSKLQAYFDAVQRNAERLTRLTNDLLDTQRIEEGRMTISKTPIGTGELLRDLAQEATPGLTRRGQTLKVSDGFGGVIDVDRDRLLQVLANLVGNASKFSPEGSTIQLSVERRGGEVVFSIRDQGVGLSEEDMPKLFKPFPGIHVEGNREGTGLGLSICRGIVELHGGSIWAESGGPGRGSTFSFTVPGAET
ncbi:MAG: ATP-binding protein, partial [Candidatus Bathyarchaeia archaeon]